MLFGLAVHDASRCVKITDDGLLQVLQKCSSLQTLNLYALSGYIITTDLFVSGYIDKIAVLSSGTDIAISCSFTDKAYKKISLLADLRFLDLCGAQVGVGESQLFGCYYPFFTCGWMSLFEILDISHSLVEHNSGIDC